VDRGAKALIDLPFHQIFDFVYYLRTRHAEDQDRVLIDHLCALDRVGYEEYVESEKEGKRKREMAAIAMSGGEVG
jgi:hypothetical protein